MKKKEKHRKCQQHGDNNNNIANSTNLVIYKKKKKRPCIFGQNMAWQHTVTHTFADRCCLLTKPMLPNPTLPVKKYVMGHATQLYFIFRAFGFGFLFRFSIRLFFFLKSNEYL